MTAKEYLSQAWSISIQLVTMSEQLEFLRTVALYVSPRLNDLPKPAVRNIHENEDAIIRVIEMEDRIKELEATLDEVIAAINNVSDPTQQAILTKRYLSNKSWSDIAQELFISLRHVQRLHDAALDVIANRLNLGTEWH